MREKNFRRLTGSNTVFWTYLLLYAVRDFHRTNHPYVSENSDQTWHKFDDRIEHSDQ